MWWPFRRARLPEETGPEQRQPAGPAGAGSPHQSPPAWQHAQALQRTIADDPPTSRLPEFRGHLAAHRDHRVSGSLGHYLARDAPSGRLDGVVTPSTGWTRDEPDWRPPSLATAPSTPTGITAQRMPDERSGRGAPLESAATHPGVHADPLTAIAHAQASDVAAAGLPPVDVSVPEPPRSDLPPVAVPAATPVPSRCARTHLHLHLQCSAAPRHPRAVRTSPRARRLPSRTPQPKSRAPMQRKHRPVPTRHLRVRPRSGRSNRNASPCHARSILNRTPPPRRRTRVRRHRPVCPRRHPSRSWRPRLPRSRQARCGMCSGSRSNPVSSTTSPPLRPRASPRAQMLAPPTQCSQ